ncbi:AbrB family transcriptional regulator [Neobacillus mesonae]|uniref:AbrB family transcriptional regulator n=1 Tax=Neobacillus mesonae TaxID=1193713 RepID=UPI00082B0D59|nr:AbrB family transcriptional regulator [Neobacillus mesonae]
MNQKRLYILLLCILSGYFVSLTGISVGWMIGAFLIGGIFSLWIPSWIHPAEGSLGVPKYWMFIGQWILGVELGQKMNTGVFHLFIENWLYVITILLVSILFSLLSGYFLWRFSQTDFLTSFIGTAPGGISVMPIFAEEIGANPALVSIIQIIRVLLVIGTVPLLAIYWTNSSEELHTSVIASDASVGAHQLFWMGLVVLLSVGGSFLAKYLKFPTPWLLGSMIVVAIWQAIGGLYKESFTVIYWPHWLLVISQLLIGVSIGSRFTSRMFVGIKRTLLVGSLGSVGLIMVMALCATVMSKVTDISWITAILAFAPGGIAEMAATAVALDADSTFVVVVQVLRIGVVITVLPTVFKFLERRITKKEISMTK